MTNKHPSLFSPFMLTEKIKLRNRIVMAPMTTWSANPDGTISEQELEFYKRRSQNVGLRASGQYTDNLLFTGPDGLKIQVFRRTLANLTTVGVVNSVPVTFPVPFPVNCWGVFSTKLTWVQITNSCEWVSNTGFTAQVMMNIAVNTNTSDAMFLAIGY